MAHAIDEPFGGIVEDYRAGIGASVAINMNRVAKEGEELPPPVTPYQLIPWRPESRPAPPPEPPEQTPEELSSQIRALLNRKAKAARKNGN